MARVLRDAESKGLIIGYREGRKVVYRSLIPYSRASHWLGAWFALGRPPLAEFHKKYREIMDGVNRAEDMVEFADWVLGSLPKAQITYEWGFPILIERGKKIELDLPPDISKKVFEILFPTNMRIFPIFARAARYFGREISFEKPKTFEKDGTLSGLLMALLALNIKGIYWERGPPPRFARQAAVLTYLFWFNKERIKPLLIRRVWTF